MKVEVKIPNDAVNPILAIAKKYHLDLLGSWSRGRGEAVMVPWSERLSASELSILARLFTGEWGGGIPLDDFNGRLYRWAKLVEHYDFPKFPPLDLSLICGAVLAVWERVTMNVSPEGRIVLGGEPDYCPLYGPACTLWKIVIKEGNEIAPEPDYPQRRGARELHLNPKRGEMRPIEKVKVTVEWNANPDGSSLAPRTVQFTADANANEIIEAVGKAMGVISENATKNDDEFIHLAETSKDNICITFPDGTRETFPGWPEAVDFVTAYTADKRFKKLGD